MQQGWDDLDKIIRDSAPDIQVDERYNYLLISKLNRKKHTQNTRHTAGFSLILAGLVLMMIYTSNIEYQIIGMKYKIKTEILMLTHNFSYDKFFLGE